MCLHYEKPQQLTDEWRPSDSNNFVKFSAKIPLKTTSTADLTSHSKKVKQQQQTAAERKTQKILRCSILVN